MSQSKGKRNSMSINIINNGTPNAKQRRNSNFKRKKKGAPTKKRPSVGSLHNLAKQYNHRNAAQTPPASRSSSHVTLSIPDADNLYRAHSLGYSSSHTPLSLISEHEISYNFKDLDTHVSAKKLDQYKVKYYDSQAIYTRFLSQCECELCIKHKQQTLPSLQPAQSFDIAQTQNKLRKRNSAYNNSSVLFRAQSLAMVSMPDLLESASDLEYKQSLACVCEKDKDLSLVKIMSIGDQNNITHLMHTLNDINSKMIFNKQFYTLVEWNKNMNSKSEPTIGKLDECTTETPQELFVKFDSYRRIHNKNSSSATSQLNIDCNTPNNYNNGPVPILMFEKFRKIECLHQAIRTYHTRLAKPLDFNPQYLINDDVSEIIDIIKVVTHMVKCCGDEHGMPCQFDLMIICGKTEENKTENSDDDDDDDIVVLSDGDLSTDDEDDGFDNGFGDIGTILESRMDKNHFHSHVLPLERTEKGIKSFLKHLKNRNINVFKKSTQNGRYVIIVDRFGKHTGQFRIDPRYIALTDKMEDKYAKDCDKMYFFQPPSPFGDIIGCNSLVEVLHLNTLKCLLPRECEEKKSEMNGASERAANKEYFGAKDACKGQMICVSFHLLSEDEIRCYLYVDQKYVRIDLDKYLYDVLSCYIKNSAAKSAENVNKSRKKYQGFAFETNDIKFQKYFNGVQEQLQEQFKKTQNKNESPMELDTASMH